MPAFDGSENVAGALEFVGVLLEGLDYEVSLFHVMRRNVEERPEYQHIFSSKEYTRAAGKEMAETLKAAQIKWIDMGLKPDKVSTQIGEKAISRAETIVDRAKQEDFGTIVMEEEDTLTSAIFSSVG